MAPKCEHRCADKIVIEGESGPKKRAKGGGWTAGWIWAAWSENGRH